LAAPSPTSTDARAPVSLYPILAVNFVGTLGFSIVLPFLIFLVARWGGNALIYGVLGASYSAFQLIGAPILGRWSDVYGRRRILLLSHLGTLLSWVVFVVAFALPERSLVSVDSEWLGRFTLTLPLAVVFLARALDGLTGGNVSVANAYLSDVTSDDDRNTNFGKMAVSANLGFIVGPAIAGVLGATVWGELLPIVAALLISAATSLLIIFRLPESNPCVMAANPDAGSARRVFGQEPKPCVELLGERPSNADLLRLEGVPLLLVIYFLVMLGFNFFYVAFPPYAANILRWTVRETGAFFSVMSVLMVVVQGPVLSRAARRWTDGVLALVGGVLLALSFPLFAGHSVAMIYAGVVLLALGNGLMWPSIVSILSRVAGDRYQGAVQGLASSCGAVASILGLLLGGFLFEILEARVFLVSAAVIGAVAVLTIRLAVHPVGELGRT